MSANHRKSDRSSTEGEIPEITDEWISGADLYVGEKLIRRGRPKLESPKQLLSLRLSPEVIARWRSSGPGWQTRMASALEKTAPPLTNKCSRF